MSQIVGCIAMSHGPQLLAPPERWDELPSRTRGPFNPKPGIAAEITPEAKKAHAERCTAAIARLRDILAEWRPDTVVIFGDDQEENILFDNMTPFTIYIGAEADATLKFRYFGAKETDQITRYRVDDTLARELLDGALNAGFDPAWSKELRYHAGLGHAFGRALDFLMPRPLPAIVPIMVNTYYPPAPSARRCFAFGQAIGAALRSSARGGRVVVIGSGGLSHTKIDETLDRAFIDALERHDTDYLQAMPSDVLVGGTSEIRNWIAVAGVAAAPARMIDYVPCYRAETGVGCAMGFAAWERVAA